MKKLLLGICILVLISSASAGWITDLRTMGNIYMDWEVGNATFGQYISYQELDPIIKDYINWTDGNNTYVEVKGDTMTGNLSAQNITAQEYFYGQPIAGGIQGGIVWAAEIDGFGQVNLTHEAGTLNIGYPDMTVRIVTTPEGDEKYCDIPADTIAVNDNAHEAYAVSGTDCSISTIPVSAFVDADINQAGNTPIFHAMAHSGEIEVHQGMPIQNRNYIRSRILHLKTINLDVLNGMSLVEEEDLDFTINSGEYVFVDQPVTATIQNITDGATLELFGRDGTNYFYDDSANGLNLTTCEDASQDQVECSLTSRYRRYFIFITGYEDGCDDTLLHQRLALDDVNYVTLANCLNIETNPVTYELPDIYDYTAVPLYAYCLQAKNTELSDGAVIDLRRFKTGSASGGIDTSVFLTKDGSRPLTDNWDAVYNITTDTLLADYVEGDGSRLTGLTNHTDEVYNTWGEWFYNQTQAAYDLWNVVWSIKTTLENVVFNNGTNLPSTWDVTNYTAGTGITVSEHEIASTITDTTCATSGTCPQIYQDTTLISSIYLTIANFFTHIDNIIIDYYNKTEADNKFIISEDMNIISELNTQVSETVLYSGGTLTSTKWCVADGTAGGIDCNVEPVVNTDTHQGYANIAMTNDTNVFAEDQVFDGNITLPQNNNVSFGDGSILHNGSCLLFDSGSGGAVLEICQ